jgi:hypothetical protein
MAAALRALGSPPGLQRTPEAPARQTQERLSKRMNRFIATPL